MTNLSQKFKKNGGISNKQDNKEKRKRKYITEEKKKKTKRNKNKIIESPRINQFKLR